MQPEASGQSSSSTVKKNIKHPIETYKFPKKKKDMGVTCPPSVRQSWVGRKERAGSTRPGTAKRREETASKTKEGLLATTSKQRGLEEGRARSAGQYFWDVQYVVVPAAQQTISARKRNQGMKKFGQEVALSILGLESFPRTEGDILEAFRGRVEGLEQRRAGGSGQALVEAHEAYQVLIQQLRARRAPSIDMNRREAMGNIYKKMQTIAAGSGCSSDSVNFTC